jgi:hypothetical protein
VARIMRTVQPLLPLATVFVCLVLSFGLGDWLKMQDLVNSIHRDAFTLDRSAHALWLTKRLVPLLLAISLPIFVLFKRRFAGHRKWQWNSSYCFAVVLVTVSLVLRLWQCPLAMDDAYVDYRYVQHWLSGQFDYNPGVHIMGFTSHLHLVALWAICSLFHTQDVDMASYYLSCALDTANTIFLFFIARKVYGGPCRPL